jgi:hypothetical protein
MLFSVDLQNNFPHFLPPFPSFVSKPPRATRFMDWPNTHLRVTRSNLDETLIVDHLKKVKKLLRPSKQAM